MNFTKTSNNRHFDYLNRILFTIIIPLLSIFPIIINLVNDFTLRKVKVGNKKLGLLIFNVIIDIILFLMVILQSLTECREYCSNLWSNNYWLIVYQLYISSYFENIFNTISSCLYVINTWNRYYVMNDYKISNRIIYSILIIQFFYSIISNLPNLFLNEIQLISNQTNVNNSLFYELKSIQMNPILDLIFKIYLIITSIIFIISLILIVKLLFLMQKKINSKYTDDDECANNLVIKRSQLKSIESIALCHRLSSLSPEELDSILSNFRTCRLESETSMFVFLIVLTFTTDQFFKNLKIPMFFYLDNNSIYFFIFYLSFFSLLLLIQLVQLIINYKFNQCFSKRLKFLYQNLTQSCIKPRKRG
jgi:hypothetical protein